MTTDTTAHTETEIRAVLDEHAAAHAARDADRLFAAYSTDPVCYTLAPPLQQGPDTPYGTPDGLRVWFATFDGPVHIHYRDPVVTATGDVAFVHTLTQMSATPAGSDESFSFWFRPANGQSGAPGPAHPAGQGREGEGKYMRDRFLRFAVPLLLMGLVAAACSNNDDNPGASGATGDTGTTGATGTECNADIKVGIAFDVGGLGDKSFNDAANAGLQQAIADGLVCEENVVTNEANATGSDRDRRTSRRSPTPASTW